MSSSHRAASLFFFIVFLILVGGLGYFYYINAPAINGNSNISFTQASLTVSIDSGPCPTSFGCHESYELKSDGNIYHNEEYKTNILEDTAQNLIKKSYNVFQSKKCTAVYAADVFETYELNIDNKLYSFGSRGCKEMQNALKTIKESN